MQLDETQIADIVRLQGHPALWMPTRTGSMSAWWGHVPFAHWIVSQLRPRCIVELGTHNGVSFAAFCEAVQRQHQSCRCYAVDTWQGDDHAGRYGEGVFADLRSFIATRFSSFAELMRMTFDEALPYFAEGFIDLLHIDGLHTYEAVKADFVGWLPKMSDRGVILFHDINVRERGFGVWQLWEELRSAYPSFEFLHGHGLGVIAVGREMPAVMKQLAGLSPDDTQAVQDFFAQLGSRWITADLLDRQLEQVVATRNQMTALQHELAARSEWLFSLFRQTYRASLERARPATSIAVSPHGAAAAPQRVSSLPSRLSGALRKQAGPGLPMTSTALQGLSAAEVERVRAAFDTSYYLETYPDIGAETVDLLDHYLTVGWREGYNPARNFITSFYLSRWPDVADAGINPFVHWVLYGSAEGREATPPSHSVKPRLTAIILASRHVHFLPQRIESLLAQSSSGIEIVIQAEASDERSSIIRAYCERYPDRIRSIASDQHAAPFLERLRPALAASSGDFILICDSDGFCEPTFVERILAQFSDGNVLIALGQTVSLNDDGVPAKKADVPQKASADARPASGLCPAAEWSLNTSKEYKMPVTASGLLVRRTLMLNGATSESLKPAGDWLLDLASNAGGQIAWDMNAVSYVRGL